MTTTATERDSLSLKWGTLKAWDIKTEAALELIKRYYAGGVSMSAMAQRDTPEQKEILCALVDAINADTVYLDWDGKDVTKEEAKRYIREYGG